MSSRRTAFLLILASVTPANTVAAQKKKEPKEPVTQVLALPKDPPAVMIGDSTRLVFHVSPLSAKGLLTAQTHEALKAILKANGNAQILHIRAFVAGSGDVRRIPQIVSEVFRDKKMGLPSVSVIQAGGLPLEGAQVVIEATSEAKKEVNPTGVTFIPGQDSVDKLATAIGAATAIQVSCFVTDLSDAATLTSALATRFPGAAVDLVQTQRNPARVTMQCEAITRGGKPGRLAFSGTRAAFGGEESDIKLAFTRLYKDLTDAGVSPAGIVSTNIYPISTALGIVVRGLIDIPGAITIVPFEGVASMDASLAVDAISLTGSN
jgi:enamine deaminase RidA (YjgF/YER057c/UK114 family)